MKNLLLEELQRINRKLDTVHRKQMFVSEGSQEYVDFIKEEIRLLEDKNKLLAKVEDKLK
ncbi:hypothetical protein FZC83_01845 [Rossellomorea marisflavi]|uniref:Uncharacterized protein n=1 Tax=Rossellomorea marisflavi TaxID=189381 RepID=A0A5D4S2F1_9BACI|nr:hypothetical protein [Rossellomorea marisflavi]TYS56338.1 hypothetical protein FZC83_01845 [Rossellomorea marisflavi]